MGVEDSKEHLAFPSPKNEEGKEYKLIAVPGTQIETVAGDFVNRTYSSYDEVISALEQLQRSGIVQIKGTKQVYDIPQLIGAIRSIETGQVSVGQFTRNLNLRAIITAVSEGRTYYPD
jgi:hypothetical protein